MIGIRFGRLTVIAAGPPDRSGDLTWHCACDCGVSTTVRGTRLRRSETRSCGCYQRDRSSEASAKRIGKAMPSKRRQIKVENGVAVYRCGRCCEFFPFDGFPRRKGTLIGIGSYCRRCHSAVALATRNPDTKRRNSRRHQANRRAWKAGSGGVVTEQDWIDVMKILGTKCLKCGSEGQMTQDHIIPLSKGGIHHPSNLQPLCRSCNEIKQASAVDYRSNAQRFEVFNRWVIQFRRVKP